MYSDFAKSYFDRFKGTDHDYLLICNDKGGDHNEKYSVIPSPYPSPNWETLDEAIEWHLQYGYKIIEIYDLYAEFEKSCIRTIKAGVDADDGMAKNIIHG